MVEAARQLRPQLRGAAHASGCPAERLARGTRCQSSCPPAMPQAEVTRSLKAVTRFPATASTISTAERGDACQRAPAGAWRASQIGIGAGQLL